MLIFTCLSHAVRTALPNGCTPLGSEASAASQEESQSLTCDFSACEEHSPGSPDNDCCGWDDQTFCPQGYIKSKVPTSQPGVRWINAPAGFPTDWGGHVCSNTAPYNGNTCCHSASLVGSATYTAISGRGCSSYVHMDDPDTHGVKGGYTTLAQCAAAVLAYNGQDGCVAKYFFFESGGYCNCPRDATCSGMPNSNAGGDGQLYRFTGGSTLFVVRPSPLELSPRHRPAPPLSRLRLYPLPPPLSPARTPGDGCPSACTARRSPPRL